MRGWKRIFHASRNQKKARVKIFISDKIDFKIETFTRDKEGHYIIVGGINPRRRYNSYKSEYIRQLLTPIKEEIDSNTVIVGEFNTSLTPMDSSSKMKINKETEALNDTIDQN